MVIVLSTFFRLMTILFVVPKLSQLLVICFEMLNSATTFMIIYMMYTMMMVALMQTLFQESIITFSTIFYSIRTLFDGMMGMYDWDVPIQHEVKYTIIMYVHIFFSNVFLLNYLVAILGSVYE